MGVLQRVVKPRNQKSKKALENREPKSIENNKSSLFIRGANCSQNVLQCLRDLHSLKKPDSDFYSQKNDIRPFEDFTKLEFFSQKHDVALFAVGTHNKKRPDNLIMGRFYDHKMLDMMEFGVENFKGLADFASEKIPIGTKPCLLFSGSLFETNEEMKRAKNLLIDFFRGPKVPNIRLQGLGKSLKNSILGYLCTKFCTISEHAIQFTAVEKEGKQVIYLRSYRIDLKKSGSRLPRVELTEMGPNIDLVLRRHHLASEDLFKSACKQVKNIDKPKKVKNISKDAFGTTLGRLHVPAQNIGSIQTRKIKGLKETPEEKKLKKMIEIKAKKDKAEAIRKANIESVFAE